MKLFGPRGQVVEGVATRFCNEHYDTVPVHIVSRGGATRLFGLGIVPGVSDVFGDVTSGNVGLSTVLKAGNIIPTLKI